MGILSQVMGINRFAVRANNEPRDDLYVTRPAKPGIQAAILAGIEAQRQATAKARVEALTPARCTEIERKIFNQVAVGGIRHGRS
jgi:hypothetical protein